MRRWSVLRLVSDHASKKCSEVASHRNRIPLRVVLAILDVLFGRRGPRKFSVRLVRLQLENETLGNAIEAS